MCESPASTGPDALLVLEELVEQLNLPSPPEPLAVDAVIAAPGGESFRVVSLLGNCPPHSGNCYEAVAEGDGREVWLHDADDDSTIGRLRHEASAMQALDCQLFPRNVLYFESDGKAYLVTEPIAGTRFEEALASGPLPLTQVLAILAQVAFALTHMHERGWAHLGLRPAAIVLGRPVKIVDFSYATRIGDSPREAFYHAGFSPPEILASEPIDARSDIYALGALLLHATTGHEIAETGAESGAWLRSLDGQTLPAGMPQILTRCLGSRETRYSTMAELHHDLLRLSRRSRPAVSYSVATATSVGLEPTRTTNQDANCFLTGHLECEEGHHVWTVVCVADGMGGMAAGDTASHVAATTVLGQAHSALSAPRVLSSEEPAKVVRQRAHAANEQVCAALETHGARGGTTLLCACVIGHRLAIAHVGDCRLYLLREGAIRSLTRDHSVAMTLALQGEISLDDVRQHPDRSTITRSLGDRRPMPDHFIDTLEQSTGSNVMNLQAGDVLLFCSDGLWEPVLEEEMVGVVGDHAPDLNAAAHALIGIALQRGAPDNATVVLLRMDNAGGQAVARGGKATPQKRRPLFPERYDR